MRSVRLLIFEFRSELETSERNIFLRLVDPCDLLACYQFFAAVWTWPPRIADARIQVSTVFHRYEPERLGPGLPSQPPTQTPALPGSWSRRIPACPTPRLFG